MTDIIPEVVNNDTGSVSTPSQVPAETSSQTVTPPAPNAETVAPKGDEAAVVAPNAEAPKAPVVDAATGLVELPDGRKVDAATAGKEYRTLLADHTRKSQELARLKTGQAPADPNASIIQPVAKKSWEDPNWQPQSYQEILNAAVDKIQTDAERSKSEREAQDGALAANIDSQVAELKKTDPTLNEAELFKHAHKYKFGINIAGAYQNMKDMSASVKKAQEITAGNIARRNAEPIAGGGRPASVIADGDTYDPRARNTSLSDVLRSLKP